MALGDDPGQLGDEKPPAPSGPVIAPGPSRRTNQFGLGKLMVWTIYIALIAAVGRGIWMAENSSSTMLWLLGGVGLCVLGLWIALTARRLAPLGWVFFIVGMGINTIVTTGPLAIPSLPILIGGVVFLCHRKRANNQDALLDVLALAASSEMPLAPTVLAFTSQASGMFRIWSETLAEMLARGVSLSGAIGLLPRLFARRSAFLIRIGSECGHLAAGLREAIEARSTNQPTSRQVENKLIYLAWLGLMWLMVFGFLMYFVMPKFEAIFKDFGMDLPEATKVVIKGTHLAVAYFYVPSSIVLGSIAFVLLFLDRLFPRRHTLLLLRGLALCFDAGIPISTSVGRLAAWYPTRWVRLRLELVEEYVRQGHDWIAALRSTGLVNASDAGVLASAQHAGNLPWAIRELIASGERRRNFRLAALLQLGYVAAIVAHGALVLLLTVAYFMPLTTLITRLS